VYLSNSSDLLHFLVSWIITAGAIEAALDGTDGQSRQAYSNVKIQGLKIDQSQENVGKSKQFMLEITLFCFLEFIPVFVCIILRCVTMLIKKHVILCQSAMFDR
jgi:hypothetical protein